MARKRMLSPDFFTSPSLAALPLTVRHTFEGLWVYCDDEGRGKDVPALVKAAVWPLDKATPKQIDAWIDQLAESRKICRYTIDGEGFLHVINWTEHQKPSHPAKSVIPPCLVHELGSGSRESLASLSRISREALSAIQFSSGEGSSGDAGGHDLERCHLHPQERASSCRGCAADRIAAS